MNRIILFFSFKLILFSFCINAQDYNPILTGYWYGLLEGHTRELILTFEIKEENNILTGTLNSPMQGASNIPITEINTFNDSLKITIASLGVTIKGKLHEKDTVIIGVFSQAFGEIPIKFIKTPQLFTFIRPQEPKPPFKYFEEKVEFENTYAQIRLAGTLTYPNSTGKFPAVVLITGSGPQNRDEEILGHKPFFVIADYFTNKGLAVLRVDDRGVGQSGGNFATSTTEDFATDVKAAISFLKKHERIIKDQIGLLGHSEGGMIAPMVASKDETTAFIILLGGPALPGKEVLLTQLAKILEVENTEKEFVELMLIDQKKVYSIIRNQSDNQKAIGEIKEYLNNQAKNFPEEKRSALGYEKISIEISASQLTAPWFRYFLTFNPEDFLKQVKCPVLAIFGEKDVQVTLKENVEAMKKIITTHNKSNIEIIVYPNKNHLFQNADTGAVFEYALIEETICTNVLEDMAEWILKVLDKY